MKVGIIMGSKSDWPTMQHAAEMLERFNVAYETKVVSAHRTPHLLAEYAETARSRGISVIIAWRWRCGTFTRNDSGFYQFACPWCTCAITCFKRHGLTIINCANA